MTISDRIRVKSVRPLSNGHFKLNAVTFDWRRDDGQWQTQSREVLDRGGAAVLLPYNLAQRTVVLVRQFRYPAYATGYDDLMIEAIAGLLDNAAPEERIRLEAEEEYEQAVPVLEWLVARQPDSRDFPERLAAARHALKLKADIDRP